jgi:pimeloyl-ACP methyl ester carboxylesterase
MECQVRDITIYYEEIGAGRPLLLLHGDPVSSELCIALQVICAKCAVKDFGDACSARAVSRMSRFRVIDKLFIAVIMTMHTSK